MNSLAASCCHIKVSHMNSLTASRRHMILHFSLQFFYCSIYWSGCWSSWENLDRLKHRPQPVKFLDSVVPSPCETDNFVLSTGLTMWIGHPKDSMKTDISSVSPSSKRIEELWVVHVRGMLLLAKFLQLLACSDFR